MSNPVIFYQPVVKPYSTKQLCCMYCVTYKIMNKWIKEHLGEFGKKSTHLFTVAQVAALFKAIGVPIVNDDWKGTGLRKHEKIAIVIPELPLEQRLRMTGGSSGDVQ